MRTSLIVAVLTFCLTASAQTFEYFCVAKQAASVTIKPGSNSPVFESDSGATDVQWIVAKGKVRSLDGYGEIPCQYFENRIHCIFEEISQPYFTVILDDNTFVYQGLWKLDAGGNSWRTYAGTCVSVPAD